MLELIEELIRESCTKVLEVLVKRYRMCYRAAVVLIEVNCERIVLKMIW